MANLKSKSWENLSDWNIKELRKLKISLKNRIDALSFGNNPKELRESNPLSGKTLGDCQNLLTNVLKAERNLK